MKCNIQVVICECCVSKPALLDIPALRKIASEAGNVTSVVVADAVCDGENLSDIIKEAKEKEVDRAIVLACHKRDVDPSLFKAYARAGVPANLVEVVNLREEVVLPGAAEPERAQAKAEAKLNAAIARVRMLEPLEKDTEEMRTRNIVIIGAGVAGRAAAEVAARSGAHTIMIEKTGKSLKSPGILMSHTTVIGGKGYGGNFTLRIKAGEKVEDLDCAAVIVATGGGWATLKGPLAKACKDAIPLFKLHEKLESGIVPTGPVVIVDTPDPSGKNVKVQDFAWEESLETAARLKKANPDTDVWVVFQEMRAFGLSELAYKEAAELGVRFVRYDKPAPPKIDPKEPAKLTVKDSAQAEVISIKFGTLVFASIPANADNERIADALRIPMSPEGGVRRGSIQRWPVSTPRPGVFVCGSALFPKSRAAAEAEGTAAGELAAEFVKKGEIEFGGIIAKVEQEKCSACLTCVRTCPYEAPFIGEAGKIEIKAQLCQGCGMCAGICPSKAIELLNYTDDQLGTEARTLLGGDF